MAHAVDPRRREARLGSDPVREFFEFPNTRT